MPEPPLIRLMTEDDVAAAERLTSSAFYDLDLRTHRAGDPQPAPRSATRAEAWRRRVGHILQYDAPGCWVAEDDSGLVGVVASMRRDLTWILSTFGVRPGQQGRGIGRRLLDAASSHGRNCLRGMLSASSDQAAVRRYHHLGFDLHPQMYLHGPVARDTIPVVERVREGSAADFDLLDSVDRRVRDAAHGVDHELLASMFPLVVADRSTGSGYVYLEPHRGPHLLAATDRRTATDLLWEALAATDPAQPALVPHISGANGWAVDVGMAARMSLQTEGYLALRGMKPPAPYLHSGLFL